MFMSLVNLGLMFLLFLCSGAAIDMGIFKSHRPGSSFLKKASARTGAYLLSGLFWFFAYSHHYLEW